MPKKCPKQVPLTNMLSPKRVVVTQKSSPAAIGMRSEVAIAWPHGVNMSQRYEILGIEFIQGLQNIHFGDIQDFES